MALLEYVTSSVEEDRDKREEEKWVPHYLREDEELNLPYGYRFIPRDSELILNYLFDKIIGLKLPCDIIREIIDLYECDPEQLPISEFAYGKINEAYFFTYTKQGDSREGVTTKYGYWKSVDEDVSVFDLHDRIVGFKKTFVFHRGNAPHTENTPWRMNEFRVNPKINHPCALNDNVRSKIKRYVVCRIRYKDYEDENESIYRIRYKDYEDENESAQYTSLNIKFSETMKLEKAETVNIEKGD